MSLSPRGLCLGLCWACAALVLRLWACAPGNPFHAAHPLGRLVPSGLRVLRLWAPCPLARASLVPCAPFCVRPRGGCAEHPLGRSVPSRLPVVCVRCLCAVAGKWLPVPNRYNHHLAECRGRVARECTRRAKRGAPRSSVRTLLRDARLGKVDARFFSAFVHSTAEVKPLLHACVSIAGLFIFW